MAVVAKIRSDVVRSLEVTCREFFKEFFRGFDDAAVAPNAIGGADRAGSDSMSSESKSPSLERLMTTVTICDPSSFFTGISMERFFESHFSSK